MIWIIIGLVISLWIWFSLIHTKGTKICFGECIVILIVILTAGSVSTLFGDAIISYTDTEYSYDELDSSTKIIALKDRQTTEGNFFLGFGSVDNSNYYCYYTENDAGDVIKTSSSPYHNHQQTVIYIPKGSIEQNYKIDME